MKTFKKLFAYSAIFALLATMMPTYANAASYDAELTEAYAYAKGKSITTMDSIDNADMYGNLTRIAMAKMVANYVLDLNLQELDTTKECNFPDVSEALDAAYDNGVTKACQLGLMGVGIEKFNPNGIVTRAEFGTVLSRALWGEENNGGNPYYAKHLQALKDEGIMNKIDNPNMKEVRGYVMLMMMRADDAYTPAVGCSAEELLACILADDYDACIAACSGTEDPTDPVEVKLGKLNVTMANAGMGGDIPNSITALPVVTYKFAADEDISITALTLEQVGFGTDDTITNAALFIDGKRVSNLRDLNINTKRVINLSSAYTVKKGGSVDIEVRVTVNNSGVASQQFAVKLTDVASSAANLNLSSSLTSSTYKVVGTVAATLTFDDRASVEEPKV